MNAVKATDLVEDAKRSVERIRADFKNPDDDWDCIMLGEEENGTVTIIAFDPEFMASSETKDLLTEIVIPRIIKQFNFVAVAMVVSSWSIHVDPGDEWTLNEVRKHGVVNHPLRKEQVMVNGIDLDRAHACVAEIIRHDDEPPELGPWQDIDELIEGRFVDPIRKALQDAKTTDDNSD